MIKMFNKKQTKSGSLNYDHGYDIAFISFDPNELVGMLSLLYLEKKEEIIPKL